MPKEGYLSSFQGSVRSCYSEQRYSPKLKPFVIATYGVVSSYTLMMELAQLMGAPLIMTNGWASQWVQAHLLNVFIH